MELHQLRYFVAVAQTGSFSRAAERCHVSQPSLSQQIQKLERRLKQKLFDRLGRSVVMTEAGNQLLDRAVPILAAVEDTKRILREADDPQGGRLAIGAIPTIAPYLLPPALKKLLHLYPNVELTVREELTDNLLGSLLAGDLDLGVLALPIPDDRLHLEELFTEPLLLALPRGHRFVHRRHLSLDDLQEEPFILLDEMHCLGQQIVAFCRAGGCHPRITCKSAQIATVQSLIGLGQGVSLLPAMAKRQDRDPHRTYRRLSKGQPTRAIAVAWHRQRYHSPVAERFLQILRSMSNRQSK